MKNTTSKSYIFFAVLISHLLFTFETTHGQEQLFINKETLQALKANTRSADGMPGKSYWQNSSNYNINAVFNPATGILEGREDITYYNNSPDTLKTIVVRLYQDIFKKGNKRISEVDPTDLTEGVVIKSIIYQKEQLSGNNESAYITRAGTNMYIKLPQKLAPKSSANIHLEWSFKIPSKTQLRMGTYDSSSFFVGQWYPQIAVYDDIRGWDIHDYNGLAEFYNDFSNFEVGITVPGGYAVWATGKLTNGNDVMNAAYYDKIQEAMNSDKMITIAVPADYKNGKLLKNNEWNTWKYEARNVSDFAFALSDHYTWEASSVVADKTTGKKVFIQTAYNENHPDYKEVHEIEKKTIEYLSGNFPGTPFPFPCMTVFDGADGMEYPMITNVGSFENRGETVYAQSHEIAHTYLPFLVGTNETMSGWMDESMTVFLPEELQKTIEPSKDVATYTTYVYSYYAGKEYEPAVMTPTIYLTSDIYFMLNYGKGEQILRLLEMQLGKDMFKKCLKEFINRWKYKHPTPYDFFNTFNDISGQDLTWFWKSWFFEQGIPDLSISSASWKDGKCTVKIKNIGGLPLPVSLTFVTSDGKTFLYEAKADIWKDGKKEVTLTQNINQKVTEIKLGNSQIPDSNPSDNKFKLD